MQMRLIEMQLQNVEQNLLATWILRTHTRLSMQQETNKKYILAHLLY